MATTFINGRRLLVMPGLPLAPATIEYKANPITAATTAVFTGGQQVFDWQQGFMEWSLSMPPISEEDWPAWSAFLKSCRGVTGVFQFGDPRRQSPRGSVAGAPVVNGIGQTGYSLSTSGWTANSAGVLLPGDYIQLGYRLHECIDTVDADSLGHATFEIWPPLRESPSGGEGSPPVFEPVITSNTKGLWCMKSNSPSWSIDDNRNYHLTFELREAI